MLDNFRPNGIDRISYIDARLKSIIAIQIECVQQLITTVN